MTGGTKLGDGIQYCMSVSVLPLGIRKEEISRGTVFLLFSHI